MATRQLAEEADDTRVVSSLAPKQLVQGLSFPVRTSVFRQNTQAARYFQIALREAVGTLTLWVYWYARGGTPLSTVTWSAAMGAITPGDAVDVARKPLAAAASTAQAIGNPGVLQVTQITFANTDSVAVNDLVFIKLFRAQGDAGRGCTVYLVDTVISFV